MTDDPQHHSPARLPPTSVFELVTLDLYRDIHKGIRAELFAVTAPPAASTPPTASAGPASPATSRSSSTCWCSTPSTRTRAIQPVLERTCPAVAERIAATTTRSRPAWSSCGQLADDERRRRPTCGAALHRSTSSWRRSRAAYLAHQDIEERVVMPALDAAIGFEGVLGDPPGDRRRASRRRRWRRLVAMMLPAMNIDDRAELLGGMKAGAPPEVFAGVWSLAGSWCRGRTHAALAPRLGRTN